MQTFNVSLIQVLRNRRFRTLWLGQVVSFIGDYFYFLAVPILINKLTGSVTAIGAAMIFTFALPNLVMGLPAGVIVDRLDRRRVMIAADVLRAVVILAGLLVRDAQSIWILYVVGFLVSCGSRFFFPARSALVPLLVSEDELMAANGLMGLTETISLLAGPMLAGFTIGWFGSSIAFSVDSVSFLVSAAAIWSLGKVENPKPAEAQHQASAMWQEMVDGLRFILGQPILRGTMLCLMVIHLGLGAINVLWVPFLSNRFGVGPEGLGLVDALQGMGMAAGGVAIGWLSARFAKTTIGTVSLVFIGLALGLMGVAPGYLYILILGFILGVPLPLVNAVVSTLTQQVTPDRQRGRVFGATGTLTQVASLVSMGAAAGASEWLGIPAVYLICGGLIASSAIIFAATIREPRAETGTCPEPIM